MIKIGLFIIPNLSLKNFISKLKSLVRKKNLDIKLILIIYLIAVYMFLKQIKKFEYIER